MGLLHRIDTQLQLFNQVGTRAGISFERAGGVGLEHEMRRAYGRCIFCRRSKQCREWLNGETEELYPDFCPNADFFARHGRARAEPHTAAAA